MKTLRAVCARLLYVGTPALAVALVMAGSAAAAGKPVTVGMPLSSAPPAVAVDGAGDAFIAWANTKDVPPATTNFVQYCILPVSAVACTHSGALVPSDSAAYIDDVQVIVDGGTLVVLADVYGAAGPTGGDYAPEQEWTSTDGGATFTAANAGLSVASGILNADSAPLGAVIVPGTGVLGYGWNTAGGSPPTFNAFPLASPPECSTVTCAAGFASLEPNTNPDQLGNGGGQFAAESGAAPGVIGIFDTDFTNGPLGCSATQTVPFGTAYAYGSGNQSATNNYNLSPGTPNSAWKVPVTLADCNVDYPAVAGGPSGFGVLEDNELTKQTVYHRFNPATQSFSTPQVTVAAEGEQSPALSQDGAGGVYATYRGGPGGAIRLAYSSDGGSTWSGPTTLNPDSDGGASSVTSAVSAAGQGWAVWDDNGSVLAQPFTAQDAATPAVVSPSATSTSGSVTITVTCSATPCTVVITVTIPAASTASIARATHKKTGRPTALTLATGRFVLTAKGQRKLQLHLTSAGKRYLSTHHGHVRTSVRVRETIGSHISVLTTKAVTITVANKK